MKLKRKVVESESHRKERLRIQRLQKRLAKNPALKPVAKTPPPPLPPKVCYTPVLKVGGFDLRRIFGVWVPATEEHLTKYLSQTWRLVCGVGTYQYPTLAKCLEVCKKRGLVLDIGGHVGTWSMHFAQVFKEVVAFEPSPVHFFCHGLNCPHDNAECHLIALGEKGQNTFLTLNPAHGMSDHIGAAGEPVCMKMLDDFSYAPDLIKIDVESYEFRVVKGGERTIRTHKPVMCIEQKGHGYYSEDKYAAKSLLESWGYTVAARISDDFIMVPKP